MEKKDKKDFLKFFERFKWRCSKKAENYVDDPDKMVDLLKRAKKKANSKKGSLEEVWDKLQLLFSLAGDYAHGRYKKIPFKSITLIIVGILYLISPIDAIPDFIVGLGLLDDATVLGFIFLQLKADLEKYQQWKEEEGTHFDDVEEDVTHFNNVEEEE